MNHDTLGIQYNWLDLVFQLILANVLVIGWLGLILAEFGYFQIELLIGFALLNVGLSALWWRKIAIVPLTKLDWGMIFLLILTVPLFFRPHEMILGGTDAGVYVNIGVNLAETGSILIHDPDLADIPKSLYATFFREQPDYAFADYILFPGLYLDSEQLGLIIPQFYPLQFVWQAIFYSVGGLRFSLYVTPLWGVLGCWAVFLVARQLFGTETGLLATSMLAVNATQIWFARYSTAEALTQFLLWGGLYLLICFLKTELSREGILAGLALGEATLVRIDLYFLLAIPIVYLFYWMLRGELKIRHLYFFVPFILLIIHSLGHAWFQSRPYLIDTYHVIAFQQRVVGFLILAVTGLLAVGFGVFYYQSHWQQYFWEYLNKILAVVIPLLAVYAYFFWPYTTTEETWFYWYGGHEISDLQPFNFVRLGWYLSPLGLILAVLGVTWLLWNKPDQKIATFVGVGLFYSLLFIYNNRNNPFHIYVMRRYVPIVIPFFVITGAYCLKLIMYSRWPRVGFSLALIQLVLLMNISQDFVLPVDNVGVIEKLKTTSNIATEESVILFNDGDPVGIGVAIGTPLQYIFGHTVYDLQENIDVEALEKQIRNWQAQNRNVLMVVGPSGVGHPFVNWSFDLLTRQQFTIPSLETSYHYRPSDIISHQFNMAWYEIADFTKTEELPVFVDVGLTDFPYLGEGWHGVERLADDTTFRWTDGRAMINLPNLESSDISISMRISRGTGLLNEARATKLLVNGLEVTDWQVTSDFSVYQTDITTEDTPLTLELNSETWTPGTADTRSLGVVVDWIKLETVER